MLWFLAPAVVAAEEAAWQPETPWVFAVGVLQFLDPGLVTWPDEGRVDAVMLDAFRRRGVPDKQMVFIKDSQAKSRFVAKKFVELLKQSGPNDRWSSTWSIGSAGTARMTPGSVPIACGRTSRRRWPRVRKCGSSGTRPGTPVACSRASGLHLVHYDGYPADDEWVPTNCLRLSR